MTRNRMETTYYNPPHALACRACPQGELFYQRELWFNLLSGGVPIGSKAAFEHACNVCPSVQLLDIRVEKIENRFPFKFSCTVTETKVILEVD